MRSHAPAAIFAATLAASCATVKVVECTDDPNLDIERYVVEQRERLHQADWILGFAEASTQREAESKAVEAAASRYAQEVRSTLDWRSTEERKAAGPREAEVEVPPDAVLAEAIRRAQAGMVFSARSGETRGACRHWLATAAAGRQALDSLIQRDAEPVVARFRAATDAVLGALSWLDAQDPWCEMAAAERELQALDPQRWAVSHQAVWTDELKGRKASARAQRQALRTGLSILLESGGDDEAVANLSTALLRAGVSIEDRPAPACGGQANAIALRPELELRCNATGGLHVCKLLLHVAALACGEPERLLFRAVSAQPGVGTDTADASYARIRAVADLDPREVAERVAKELRARVDPGCPSPRP